MTKPEDWSESEVNAFFKRVMRHGVAADGLEALKAVMRSQIERGRKKYAERRKRYEEKQAREKARRLKFAQSKAALTRENRSVVAKR